MQFYDWLNLGFDLFVISYLLAAFEFTVRLSYSDTPLTAILPNIPFEGGRGLAG